MEVVLFPLPLILCLPTIVDGWYKYRATSSGSGNFTLAANEDNNQPIETQHKAKIHDNQETLAIGRNKSITDTVIITPPAKLKENAMELSLGESSNK